MKLKKKLLAVVLTACMCLPFAGCGGQESSTSSETDTTSSAASESIEGSMKGVSITVATSGLFGPFSYYDTDGTTLIGYDLDLIAEIQKILGFEIKDGIQAMDYSALATSLAEKKVDVGAAALCATDERKQVMSFSQTYCDSGQVVMVNKNNPQDITGVDKLAGKKVAVEKGTASHIYAQKNLGDAEIVVHDTITTAYEALEQKKVDAVIQDGPGAAFYIKTKSDSELEVVGEEFNQGQAPYAIAYSNDFKYQDEFNAALKQLQDDGTLDEIYAKWCE